MNKIKGSLFFSVFVAMLGMMLIAPIMPPLIRELGLRESHSGLMISLGSIAMAVMAPIWGRISDKMGRKPVILMGFAGMSLSCLLFAAALFGGLNGWMKGGVLLTLLILTRSLIGAFIPAVLSASQAYMGDMTNESERGGAMAILSAANGMGLVFGPAIAGAFTVIGLLWPLYFGIVIAGAAFFVALLLIPAAKPGVREKAAKVSPLQPGLRFYLLFGLITMIGIMTIQVIGGFYVQDQLALSPEGTAQVVSFGLMCSGVAMLVVQLVQVKWLKWPPQKMLAIGSIFLVIGMLVFLISDRMVLTMLAFFIFGIGAGWMMPGFMAGASLAVGREQQGAAAGLVGVVQGVAASITPITMASLYQVDKYLPFALVAVLALAAAVGILWLARKPHVPALTAKDEAAEQ
ncbi:MFS transporter [Paenibacillus paeoniae]|uniref:MFS transporter n=1 Tax=Paenibacillus paeoniae TaxID=2292705 RepID=A0A371PKN2_9BACL|nr:MFS transporter [Paenibacillus paeoniae]REK76760.1 MFS transporter [Paenibacillus paeoniae]